MTALLPAPSTRFELPPGRVATVPPEDRGVPRDQVPLLVARPDRTDHVRFADLDRFLHPGDVVVVNTSATRPAAIDATGPRGPVVVHLAQDMGDGTWIVEVRRPDGHGPILDAASGEQLALHGGGRVDLQHPAGVGLRDGGVRLWSATVTVPVRHGGSGAPGSAAVAEHMRRHGRPITYGAKAGRPGAPPAIPLGRYQTVFARDPGSAEMASAGRPFSDRLVTRLVSAGVVMAPVTLHAGVSSQEAGEPPLPEWLDVPAATAELVTTAQRRGSRVVAVGTTVTRALESAATDDGVRPLRGWTDLVLTPDRPTRVVTGLVTGWHEADASHLLLLEAVAGPELVQQAYAEAIPGPYLWHEFGDSCLLLPY